MFCRFIKLRLILYRETSPWYGVFAPKMNVSIMVMINKRMKNEDSKKLFVQSNYKPKT